ncbi:MAG: hypothetical protein ACHQVS_01930 [Candidatus Babeliales bacterium]
MKTLFCSSMIAAGIVSGAGLYGMEKGVEAEVVIFPSSGSPASTPPQSPNPSHTDRGTSRPRFSPSPRSVPGCPGGLEPEYWAKLAIIASEDPRFRQLEEQRAQEKAKALDGEHKNGSQ